MEEEGEEDDMWAPQKAELSFNLSSQLRMFSLFGAVCCILKSTLALQTKSILQVCSTQHCTLKVCSRQISLFFTPTYSN
jgi:hypothetical protein